MNQKPDVIETWLAACEAHIERLTVWETEFIESIRGQFDRKGSLTDSQVETLERIYAEKTP